MLLLYYSMPTRTINETTTDVQFRGSAFGSRFLFENNLNLHFLQKARFDRLSRCIQLGINSVVIRRTEQLRWFSRSVCKWKYDVQNLFFFDRQKWYLQHRFQVYKIHPHISPDQGASFVFYLYYFRTVKWKKLKWGVKSGKIFSLGQKTIGRELQRYAEIAASTCCDWLQVGNPETTVRTYYRWSRSSQCGVWGCILINAYYIIIISTKRGGDKSVAQAPADPLRLRLYIIIVSVRPSVYVYSTQMRHWPSVVFSRVPITTP